MSNKHSQGSRRAGKVDSLKTSYNKTRRDVNNAISRTTSDQFSEKYCRLTDAFAKNYIYLRILSLTDTLQID